MEKEYDKRIPLKKEYKIKCPDGILTIDEEIGRGGTCIAYRSVFHNEQVEYPIIVKEFYPYFEDTVIKRDRHGNLLVPKSLQDEYQNKKKHFRDGQLIHLSVWENSPAFTAPPVINIVEKNNTLYTYSRLSNGTVLSQVPLGDLTLKDILSIMVLMCNAVSKIHKDRCLHLDIKPDNCMYSVKDKTLLLFDFDTACSLSKIDKREYNSYSDGWSPAELIPDIDGEIKEYAKIGYHTDIYSIGAVFFWLLTGRKPNETDISSIQKNQFGWKDNCASLKDLPLQVEVYREVLNDISEILKETLEEDPDTRKNSFPKSSSCKDILLRKFLELVDKTFGNSVDNEPIYSKINENNTLTKEVLERMGKDRTIILIVLICVLLILPAVLYFYPKETEIINNTNNTNYYTNDIDISNYSERELLEYANQLLLDEDYESAKSILVSDKLKDNPIAMNNLGMILLQETDDLEKRRYAVKQYLSKATSIEDGASNLLYGYIMSGEDYQVLKDQTKIFCQDNNYYACAFVVQILKDEGYEIEDFETNWKNWDNLEEKTFHELNLIGYVKYTTPPSNNDVYAYLYDSAQTTTTESGGAAQYSIYKKLLIANHNYSILDRGFIYTTEYEPGN